MGWAVGFWIHIHYTYISEMWITLILYRIYIFLNKARQGKKNPFFSSTCKVFETAGFSEGLNIFPIHRKFLMFFLHLLFVWRLFIFSFFPFVLYRSFEMINFYPCQYFIVLTETHNLQFTYVPSISVHFLTYKWGGQCKIESICMNNM